MGGWAPWALGSGEAQTSAASCAAPGAVVLRSCPPPLLAAAPHLALCPSLHWPGSLLPPTHPSSFPPHSPPGASASWTPPLPGSVMPILRDLPPPRSPPELEGTGVGTRGPSWEWALGGGKPLGPRC